MSNAMTVQVVTTSLLLISFHCFDVTELSRRKQKIHVSFSFSVCAMESVKTRPTWLCKSYFRRNVSLLLWR